MRRTLTFFSLLLALLLPGGATAGIWQPVAQLNLWNAGECTRTGDNNFSVPDTASNAAIYQPGVPMRYGDTVGAWRYGLISTVTDVGATLTVVFFGAAMSTSFDGICEYGSGTLVHTDTYWVPGAFADANDSTILLSDLDLIVPASKRTTLYLMMLCARSILDDTGADQPKLYAVINGQQASLYVTVIDSGWQCASSQARESYYDLRFGETFEIYVSADGTNDDSTDLTVQLVWVQEE